MERHAALFGFFKQPRPALPRNFFLLVSPETRSATEYCSTLGKGKEASEGAPETPRRAVARCLSNYLVIVLLNNRRVAAETQTGQIPHQRGIASTSDDVIVKIDRG
jgi:hypothetical protein